MSLEQKLARKYQKDALISDMGGYGLSGGYATNQYQKELYDSVAGPSGAGLSGGRKRGRPRGSKSMMKGCGQSGGELSGGFPFAALFAAVPAIISAVKAIKGGSSSGMGPPLSGPGLDGMSGGMTRRMLGQSGTKRGKSRLPPFMTMPDTVAGGMMYDLSQGYPSKYKGSFPMPGFSPPPDGYTRSSRQMLPKGTKGTKGGAGVSGQGLSGGVGGMVRRGPKSAAQLAWQRKLSAYRKSHPGSSLMDAMKACKGQ